MVYDVWFSRVGNYLYAAVSAPGEPPMSAPHKVSSVKKALEALKIAGHTVSSVGICPADMLGIDF